MVCFTCTARLSLDLFRSPESQVWFGNEISADKQEEPQHLTNMWAYGSFVLVSKGCAFGRRQTKGGGWKHVPCEVQIIFSHEDQHCSVFTTFWKKLKCYFHHCKAQSGSLGECFKRVHNCSCTLSWIYMRTTERYSREVKPSQKDFISNFRKIKELWQNI